MIGDSTSDETENPTDEESGELTDEESGELTDEESAELTDEEFAELTDEESVESTDDESEEVSRRAFIRATGTTAAGAGATVVAADDAEAQDVAETYRFGGRVSGWVGVEPPDIADNTNPTIELQAGKTYEMIWKNLDGAPHNLKIQNAEGQTLAGTELVTKEGATASFTFTAKPAMAQYICTVHPTTMVGDLNVTGELQGGGQGGGNKLPVWPLVMASGVVLAFISPLLFALFLFSRDSEPAQEETTA